MAHLQVLGVLSIAVTITILTFYTGWIGFLCGIVLVALTSALFLFCRIGSVDNQPKNEVHRRVVAILDRVPGITAAHPRDFERALPIMTLRNGTTVRTWKNPMGVDHVFLADKDGQMLYGAYVGWIHNQGLQKAIARIRQEFS